jgi:hypothetical protein
MSDEQLLGMRFCDLKLKIERTPLARRVRRLYRELDKRHIGFRPHVWLSEEWFSPDGVPGIAVPFYLAHPRLERLERRMMQQVEGGSAESAMCILRHEAGHAIDTAYRLRRRRRWREVFGAASQPYPDSYTARPGSRRYVQHLGDWYAQAHPCEDFAETFAVWLRPRSHWRARYAGWPALKKLEYVDELMAEIATQKPMLTSREVVEPISQLTETLEEHYRKKQALYAFDSPTSYDRDLQRLFSADPRHRRLMPASQFIRRHRAKVRELVAKWTGEYQLTLDAVVDDMIMRCRELNLRAVGSERKLVADFTVLLTAKTMHALFGPSRRKWIAL